MNELGNADLVFTPAGKLSGVQIYIMRSADLRGEIEVLEHCMQSVDIAINNLVRKHGLFKKLDRHGHAVPRAFISDIHNLYTDAFARGATAGRQKAYEELAGKSLTQRVRRFLGL